MHIFSSSLNTKNLLFIKILFISTCLAFGGFFEFVSTILFIASTAYLLITQKSKLHKFTFCKEHFWIMLFCSGFLLSIPFAVDSFMAVFGFIKFLPLIPLSIIFSGLKSEERQGLLKLIPDIGIVLIILSYAFNLYSPLYDYFAVNGQISGLFQYPNTFSLFLLIGIIVTVFSLQENLADKKLVGLSTARLVILSFGIFASGSRTLLILYALFVISLIFIKNFRKLGIFILIGGTLVGALSTVIYIFIIGDNSILNTLLSISLFESTFIGRILYMIDSVMPIITNPFGLGYQGYLYTQGAFQHGVYSVSYVHNDFLQMFLDGGFLSGISLIVLLVKAFISKTLTPLNKMILVFISISCMLDFHLQYLSVFMVLLLCLEYKAFKDIKIKPLVFKLSSILLIAVNFYFATIFISEYLSFDEISLSLYPNNTRIHLSELKDTDDLSEGVEISNSILSYNDSIAQTHRIKAIEAYSSGNIEDTINYRLKQIELSRYDISAYTEFIDQMKVSTDLFLQAGDESSANYCISLLKEVPKMLEDVISTTSPLAYLIKDKPELVLPDEYIDIINSY